MYEENEDENAVFINEDSNYFLSSTKIGEGESSISGLELNQDEDSFYSSDPEFERIDTETYENIELEIIEHEIPIVEPLLSSQKNNALIPKNKQLVLKSGISVKDILTELSKIINLKDLKQKLLAHNQNSNQDKYQIENDGEAGAVFVEAVHQFQIANFINPKEHDGIIGRSTIETLGFINHGLKQKLNSSGFYGQTILNRSDIKQQVLQETGNEFSSENWFQFILVPAWLGIKISSGIHLLLLRKLKEAETWLLSQPKYKDMTPASLGKAFGFNAGTGFSSARLSADNQAMHSFGLAIDINGWGNPWIGAGWVVNNEELLKERTRFIDVLRRGSGEKLTGSTVFAYLNSIAESTGYDTSAAYEILKKRNDEFIAYLKKNPEELKYWRNSVTFDKRNPLDGFLNLNADLVYALRQIAGLAWGAIDFGPRASGDIMHFDLRTLGIGKIICEKIGGFIPQNGHPVTRNNEFVNELEHHEAIGEG